MIPCSLLTRDISSSTCVTDQPTACAFFIHFGHFACKLHLRIHDNRPDSYDKNSANCYKSTLKSEADHWIYGTFNLINVTIATGIMG